MSASKTSSSSTILSFKMLLVLPWAMNGNVPRRLPSCMLNLGECGRILFWLRDLSYAHGLGKLRASGNTTEKTERLIDRKEKLRRTHGKKSTGNRRKRGEMEVKRNRKR